jgi:hypothetical protein
MSRKNTPPWYGDAEGHKQVEDKVLDSANKQLTPTTLSNTRHCPKSDFRMSLLPWIASHKDSSARALTEVPLLSCGTAATLAGSRQYKTEAPSLKSVANFLLGNRKIPAVPLLT